MKNTITKTESVEILKQVMTSGKPNTSKKNVLNGITWMSQINGWKTKDEAYIKFINFCVDNFDDDMKGKVYMITDKNTVNMVAMYIDRCLADKINELKNEII